MNSSTTNPSRPKLLNVMIDEDGLASLEYDDQVTMYMDVEFNGDNDNEEWLESNVNGWEGIKMTVEQECEGRKYKMYSWGLEYDVNLMVVFED